MLLIDDNVFNYEVLKELLLENFKITSTCFDNGRDAIECFKRRLRQTCCASTYRLVLTDIQMPLCDGF